MKLLRPDQARQRLGLGKSQFNQKIHDGSFPFRPIKISDDGRAVGYLESEVEDYIRTRIALRGEYVRRAVCTAKAEAE
ncbi:AlpA family phage regulatory protein [Phenylobacterium sp. LjRoot225]|uniref:helix-turn-helix transcriptional regulator n=1 Tax=Phenylobacterium sp. LjRoot225 TaxID=3342285 RepID=UPI003ECC508C